METTNLTPNQSFGERLVGIDFNPSGDDKVKRAKQLFAEAANLLQESKIDSVENGTFTAMRELFFNNAVGEVLNAQMNVVKLLTFK